MTLLDIDGNKTGFHHCSLGELRHSMFEWLDAASREHRNFVIRPTVTLILLDNLNGASARWG